MKPGERSLTMKVELFEKVKLAVMAVIGAFTAAFGFVGWLFIIWVAAMTIDYITGTCAAQKSGNWSSAAARAGLWHKAGIMAAVAVAGLADVLIGVVANSMTFVSFPFQYTVMLLPLVLAWYNITEFGSIMENAAKMGAKVPPILLKMLAQTKQGIEAVGNAVSQGAQEKQVEGQGEDGTDGVG